MLQYCMRPSFCKTGAQQNLCQSRPHSLPEMAVGGDVLVEAGYQNHDSPTLHFHEIFLHSAFLNFRGKFLHPGLFPALLQYHVCAHELENQDTIVTDTPISITSCPRPALMSRLSPPPFSRRPLRPGILKYAVVYSRLQLFRRAARPDVVSK
jgi:hypothetical protein